MFVPGRNPDVARRRHRRPRARSDSRVRGVTEPGAIPEPRLVARAPARAARIPSAPESHGQLWRCTGMNGPGRVVSEPPVVARQR